MGKCIDCGKSGVFLKLYDGRCANCSAAYVEKQIDQEKEERRKKDAEKLAQVNRAKAAQEAARAAEYEAWKHEQSLLLEFHVAGISYYERNVLSLAEDNPDYLYTKKELCDLAMTDEKIYRYSFHPATVVLQKEPDNLYDDQAIKVLVDGQQVGHVPRSHTKIINRVIDENNLDHVNAILSGGDYKIIYEDYDSSSNRSHYTLDTGKDYFYCAVTVKMKDSLDI